MYCAEKHLMDPLQYFPALVLFSSKACGNGQWISSRKQRLAQLEMQRCIAKYQDVLMARSVKESVIFLSVQKCNFIDGNIHFLFNETHILNSNSQLNLTSDN
ncbi:MAG: hypothetical protein MHMPM18_004892 [Marteilia pararefringens]